MATHLKGILASEDVDVVWHRQASGLLREPSADAVLLDGGDLVDVTAEVRRATAAPVLVVGADEYVAATCLAIGADAWLPPGSFPALVCAQLRALMRKRVIRRAEAVVEVGRLRLDAGARRAEVEGREIQMTPREFDLLRVLVENKGVVLSRDRILAGAWGARFVGEPKTVDVHVAWLRPKLERSGIRVTTLRGVGYRLDVRPAPSRPLRMRPERGPQSDGGRALQPSGWRSRLGRFSRDAACGTRPSGGGRGHA